MEKYLELHREEMETMAGVEGEEEGTIVVPEPEPWFVPAPIEPDHKPEPVPAEPEREPEPVGI